MQINTSVFMRVRSVAFLVPCALPAHLLQQSVHKPVMLFETERLLIRDLEAFDFAPFHEMQSDADVMRYTSGEAYDEAENLRQLQDCIDRYSKPHNDFWVWAIVRKSDQQFVGTCAIVPSEGLPEIGYRFLRKHFGNGYGQEVCDGLIEHAINNMSLPELVAWVDVRNVASRKILDRSRLTFIEEILTEEGETDRFYRWTASEDD